MNKIGTLSEKSVHRYLKDYFESNKDLQEVKVGNYIADIKRGNEIIEIQTKNFKSLVNKVIYYDSLGLHTTVVYPIIHKKYINWLNPSDMKVVEKRKSTKTGCIQDIFKELYWLIDMLDNKELSIKIVLIDADEYKLLDGYGQYNKNKATKVDKVITNIYNMVEINSISDLRIFIPDTLKDNWTSKDFIKATHCNNRWTASGLKMLREHNIIEVVGKQGNAIVYKRKFDS